MRGFSFTTTFDRFPKLLVYICGATFSLPGCNYQIIKTPPSGPPQQAFGENSKIESRLVQDSVLSSCGRCHGFEASTRRTSLSWIVRNIDSIMREVESNRMPLGEPGPLNACQKEILRQWLNQGMPEQSSQNVLDLVPCQRPQPAPPAKLPILEMPLNYQTLHSEILVPRCLTCHNETSESDAIAHPLWPYEKMKEEFGWSDSLTDSRKLLASVTAPPPEEGEESELMPPPDAEPPFDPAPLTSSEIEFIRRWLDAGHPE
jgi:hypothetical protein